MAGQLVGRAGGYIVLLALSAFSSEIGFQFQLAK